MMGTVHLEHRSVVILSFTPLTVGLAPPMYFPGAFFHEPGACRLMADRYALTLFELLGKEGGAEIGIGFVVQMHNPFFQFGGQPSVGRPTPRFVAYAFVSFFPYPLYDPSQLTVG
jgi:hypothetical protein